ncbi:PREDICTED: cytochrome c oxidase protein 20 homolog [Trachymyrmex cornetzi]|uniref:Cytochrome c oxidase assembly protein COX20, mitochondrial n=1 Tax=Trachymyrmex cornetzi TaxID=471704 RepID=A0A195EHH6_9HYME|nr:PREDICTED: cytochrome c oxidase protein 20 homolog [Trachymyrmex cornetzi]KYN27725.1 Protein FAM36A [Trachymyrmex cornetzi]
MSNMDNAIVQNLDEEDESKAVMLFGRDIRKIPCFKRSMLSGIYSGLAAGLGTFMFTSRANLSVNVALGSYMGVTTVYWCYCRYNYTMEKYEMQNLKSIIRHKSINASEKDKESV